MVNGQVIFDFQEILIDEINDDFGNWYLVKILDLDS